MPPRICLEDIEMNELLSQFKPEIIIPAIIGMFGITMLSTAWKSSVVKLFWFIIKHITTTIYLSSSTWMYYTFMKIIEEENVSSKLRIVKLYSGQYGSDKNINIGIAPGHHFIRLNGEYLFVSLQMNEHQPAYIDQERIDLKITKLGRDNNFSSNFSKYLANKRSLVTPGEISMSKFIHEGRSGHWETLGSVKNVHSTQSIFRKR